MGTISISSQKNSTLNTLKSYANILSGGIKKVFKPKPKEEDPKERAPEVTEAIHLPPPPTNTDTVMEETPKPEIPGLIFKEMERRPSKKKRKSRPSSSFIEPELNLVEDLSSVDESAKRLQSKIFEIMTTTSIEKDATLRDENNVNVKNQETKEIQQSNDKSKEKTLKRKRATIQTPKHLLMKLIRPYMR